MNWHYRLGKTKDGYAIYEYFENVLKDGDKSWTEEPVFDRYYETPKEAIEDITMVLGDIKHYETFNADEVD